MKDNLCPSSSNIKKVKREVKKKRDYSILYRLLHVFLFFPLIILQILWTILTYIPIHLILLFKNIVFYIITGEYNEIDHQDEEYCKVLFPFIYFKCLIKRRGSIYSKDCWNSFVQTDYL